MAGTQAVPGDQVSRILGGGGGGGGGAQHQQQGASVAERVSVVQVAYLGSMIYQ